MSETRGPGQSVRISFEGEVAGRFGVLPNFFRTANAAPGLIERLWSFAKSAYLDNPLPSLFKERLFVQLSRFCEVRYCIVRHVGFLVGLGRPAGDASVVPQTLDQVLTLLRRPFPGTSTLDSAIARVENQPGGCGVPDPEKQLEWDLLDALSVMFLEPRQSDRVRLAVQHCLGETTFEYVTALLAFVRSAHFWTETHPEVAYEPDMVQLMGGHRELADLLLNTTEAEAARSKEQLKRALLELEKVAQERVGLREALDTSECRAAADLRARRAAEQAQRASEERFRALVTATSNSVYCISPDWTEIREIHVAGRDRSGAVAGLEFLDSMESADTTWLETHIDPDDQERVKAAIQAAMREKKLFELEHRVRRMDGTVGWALTRAVPLLNEFGEITEWFGATRDITEKKAAEEKLWETQKLESLGILAGGIAHDFNNLLTGVLGNASLLAETLRGSPDAHRAEALIEASERMARLTQQMLAYSGKGHFMIKPVSLSHEVARIATLINASIPKQVALQLSLAKDLPLIEGDEGQIQQVIMNLVINAAEAVGPSGVVEVSTSVEECRDANLAGNLTSENASAGAFVVLVVSDTGCGMDPETKRRIFDPFFTTKFTGRGLGLSAVLGIVRGHRGLLTVESVPGRGSTFKVFFPVSPRTSGVDISISTENGAPINTRETVLVVDDEEVVRDAAQTALQRAGYAVVTAANGQQAVDLFRARHREIRVIILDLTMPVMGGDEALLHLRKIDPGVLVIGSSGYEEANAAAHFGTGVVAFLQKPYRADVLTHKVSGVLQQRRPS